MSTTLKSLGARELTAERVRQALAPSRPASTSVIRFDADRQRERVRASLLLLPAQSR